MKIDKIISFLKKEYSWVNPEQTRDLVLYGDTKAEVDKAAVCWTATWTVLEEAVKRDIHFIISHENLFYHFSTMPPKPLLSMIQKKQQFLEQHRICVYRCHDLWDRYPVFGVSDQYADILGFPFEPRGLSSFIHYADINPIKTKDAAQKIANALSAYGENGVMILGDPEKEISRIAIGTGAATNIYDMMKCNPDAMVVAEDGVHTYCEGQLALDLHIPLIFVNHAACEHPGIFQLCTFLQNQFPQVKFEYIKDGFHFHYITTN